MEEKHGKMIARTADIGDQRTLRPVNPHLAHDTPPNITPDVVAIALIVTASVPRLNDEIYQKIQNLWYPLKT